MEDEYPAREEVNKLLEELHGRVVFFYYNASVINILVGWNLITYGAPNKDSGGVRLVWGIEGLHGAI